MHFIWFHENCIKANQDNCHFLSSLDIITKFSLPASILEKSDSQNLFGVTNGRNVKYNEHVFNLCNKARRKIQVLAGSFPYIP